MSIVEDYLAYTKKWKKEYGDKTLVLMQVGSFFEVYALINDVQNEGDINSSKQLYGSNIEEFAKINDMVISKKNTCVGKLQVVMAGFGLPQLEKYVKKMQDHGYTIVVYRQDIQGKNTTRSLSEIISPGTFFGQDVGSQLSNNIMCVWLHKSNATKYSVCQMTIGMSNIDIFTGKTSLFQYNIEYYHNPGTYDELERFIAVHQPNECIFISNTSEIIIQDIIGFVGLECGKIHKVILEDVLTITNTSDSKSNMCKFAINAEKQIYQQEVIRKFYPELTMETLSHTHTYFMAFQSFCFLLDFVYQHSPNLVRKLSIPIYENHTDKLILANHSLKQLNMIDDTRHSGKLRSICSLLNNCITIMGKRQFNYIIHNPTTKIDDLNSSYSMTAHLLSKTTWQLIRTNIGNITDIEKFNRKLFLNKVTPKELALFSQDLQTIADLHINTSSDSILDSYLNSKIEKNSLISKICLEMFSELSNVFCLEKCAQINDLNMNDISSELLYFINPGIFPNIDKIMKESVESRDKLEAIRQYLSSLIYKLEKPSENDKNSYYVKIHETPKCDAVLIGTSRRVTILKTQLKKIQEENKKIIISYLSSYSKKTEIFEFNINEIEYGNIGSNKKDLMITSLGIRSITNELQESKDKLVKEISMVYKTYIEKFTKNNEIIEQIIKYTTELDLLQCKCFIAYKYNYCKPTINDKGNDKGNDKAFLSFTGIRHPLIEHLQTNELYVTNDLEIGKQNDTTGLLLYGTNAVGKTSFIKSVGIAVIMAQSGLYVPCKTFNYYPYSCIFTRILGNDNIFKGLSTFAVEMSELRNILNMANENSLVLGDELCSGTESDSALSIFTTGLEILHKKESTFLFATHFHEIAKYDEIKSLTKLKMMHMAVTYNNETNVLVYDRRLREGPGESMYGLEVCKSLNLPSEFLQRAHDIRMKYRPVNKNILALPTSHFNSKKIVGNCELCPSGINSKASEVHHLQHQKNAKKDKNDYIESFHKNHPANLINICNECHLKIHKSGIEHKVTKTSNGYILQSI
jgi:DNA mismatch repair protein MutS